MFIFLKNVIQAQKSARDLNLTRIKLHKALITIDRLELSNNDLKQMNSILTRRTIAAEELTGLHMARIKKLTRKRDASGRFSQ